MSIKCENGLPYASMLQ